MPMFATIDWPRLWMASLNQNGVGRDLTREEVALIGLDDPTPEGLRVITDVSSIQRDDLIAFKIPVDRLWYAGFAGIDEEEHDMAVCDWRDRLHNGGDSEQVPEPRPIMYAWVLDAAYQQHRIDLRIATNITLLATG